MNHLTPSYSRDYSLFSIPIAFGLAITPHAYSVYRMATASNGQFSNVNPRESLSKLQAHLPEQLRASCHRAQSAASNSFEVFPLFVAAVLGGKLAGIPSAEINRMALRFLGLRTLYTLVYINHQSEAGSYLRTFLYACSLAAPSWLLYRAGQVLNAGAAPVVGGFVR
ncbi:MAG: hypothetical protein M1816_007531 [Peltula sp. TS41687]|nr:MAG: hypothetical protein M1816_007531 [Peltula sp. TS41687]